MHSYDSLLIFLGQFLKDCEITEGSLMGRSIGPLVELWNKRIRAVLFILIDTSVMQLNNANFESIARH
jgi:hypothetical protein